MRKTFLKAAAAMASLLILCSCSKTDGNDPSGDLSNSTGSTKNGSEYSDGIPDSTISNDLTSSNDSISDELTDDDIFLRDFLNATFAEASKYSLLLHTYMGSDMSDKFLDCVFPQMEKPVEEQIIHPYCRLKDGYPQTLAELESELKKYFASELSVFVGKGEFEETADGTYSVNITDGGKYDDNGYLIGAPRFIEADGKLYREEAGAPIALNIDIPTARVLSRTDSEIVFTYSYDELGNRYEGKGILKYEDGWKYSWARDWVF